MLEMLIELLMAPWVRGVALLLLAAVLFVLGAALLRATWQIGKVQKHAPHLLEPDQETMEIHGDAEGERYVFGKCLSDSRLRRITTH